VAWVTREVATSPVALPSSLEPSSTVASGLYCSSSGGISSVLNTELLLGPTLTKPLVVLYPAANAVAAEEESVMTESVL